jgi:hypothetical protein
MAAPEFTPGEAERASGGITCLWYEEKFMLIITDDDEPDASGDCATL